MKYSVKILPRAEKDVASMYYYIAGRSPEGAQRWLEGFEATVSRLKENPFQYALAREDKHFDFELRQFVFKTSQGRTYRAVYRIDQRQVSILRVCGPGQGPLSADELPQK